MQKIIRAEQNKNGKIWIQVVDYPMADDSKKTKEITLEESSATKPIEVASIISKYKEKYPDAVLNKFSRTILSQNKK